jgi:hypothetical protein
MYVFPPISAKFLTVIWLCEIHSGIGIVRTSLREPMFCWRTWEVQPRTFWQGIFPSKSIDILMLDMSFPDPSDVFPDCLLMPLLKKKLASFLWQGKQYRDLESCEEGLGCEVELQNNPETPEGGGGTAGGGPGVGPPRAKAPSVYQLAAVAGGLPPADIKAYRPPDFEAVELEGASKEGPVKTPLL